MEFYFRANYYKVKPVKAREVLVEISEYVNKGKAIAMLRLFTV